MTKAYQKNEEKEETKQQENHQEHEWKEWETYQKKLGKILEETYPLRKKDTEATEPKWTTLMEKWGTEKEKEEIDQAYKMRNALQKEIDKGERDLLKQQKTEIKEKS